MRSASKTGLLAFFMLALAGCMGATRYRPHVGHRGGFAETRLGEETFKVSFEGNDDTSRTTAETYLLYRCAELTVEAGYDHFIILETRGAWTAPSPDGPGTQSAPAAEPWVPPAHREQHMLHEPPSYGATIKIVKGGRPLGAFDAKLFIRNMSSRIRR